MRDPFSAPRSGAPTSAALAETSVSVAGRGPGSPPMVGACLVLATPPRRSESVTRYSSAPVSNGPSTATPTSPVAIPTKPAARHDRTTVRRLVRASAAITRHDHAAGRLSRAAVVVRDHLAAPPSSAGNP